MIYISHGERPPTAIRFISYPHPYPKPSTPNHSSIPSPPSSPLPRSVFIMAALVVPPPPLLLPISPQTLPPPPGLPPPPPSPHGIWQPQHRRWQRDQKKRNHHWQVSSVTFDDNNGVEQNPTTPSLTAATSGTRRTKPPEWNLRSPPPGHQRSHCFSPSSGVFTAAASLPFFTLHFYEKLFLCLIFVLLSIACYLAILGSFFVFILLKVNSSIWFDVVHKGFINGRWTGPSKPPPWS